MAGEAATDRAAEGMAHHADANPPYKLLALFGIGDVQRRA
jgi:hypothetical protein